MPTEGERTRLEAELREAERDHDRHVIAHQRALDALEMSNAALDHAEKALEAAHVAAEVCGGIQNRSARRVRALREALGLNLPKEG